MNAFQVEFDRPRAVGQVLVIEAAEDFIVELGVGPLGRPRGLGLALRGVAKPVEPFQPAAVNDLVDRAAAAAAELEFLVRLDRVLAGRAGRNGNRRSLPPAGGKG